MSESSSYNLQGLPVQVSGLQKRFDGNLVLRGIDLNVQAGEIFVLMGPSGSGKSVLLRHIIGLETADQGDIRIAGHHVTHPSLAARYRLAMVFQSGALLNSLTVEENVGLYLKEHRYLVQADGTRKHYSNQDIRAVVRDKLQLVGLEPGHILNKRPYELSGGMRKRVALARAMVINPQLILYDEPTSELDPVMAVVIGREIRNLNRQIHATSIVVSHDRELAFNIADRIAIIMDGKILAVGSREEVRNSRDPAVQDFLNAELGYSDPAAGHQHQLNL